MVERRVKVTLEVAADGAVKILNDTGTAAEGAASQFDKLGKSASDNEKHIKDAGVALTAFGVGGAAALVATGRAAVDWESQWAGVTKTVDGSVAELADLEDGLRSMARELPATHEEIAAVAEAAGQLGVATPAIEGFTATMVDLGETTNLTADEAATSIAQMANVMGTSSEDIDNLGSALVALGNDGASTERQIVQMAQGMSGAAAIVGMSEADVLAVANAFASVGIEVEAGGSSFSRVITDMAKAAAQGGDELELFAEVAGVSAEEFARAFEEDPTQAFSSFIGGLGEMQAAGEDVFTVLDDLGMSDVRVSRALLSMATSGDLLTDSIELGSKAWSENTALADEAAQRYETTAAKMQVAQNNINDSLISFGEVLLPAIVGISEGIANVAGFLSDLPGPLQSAAVGVGAIATATSLLAGGALLAVPRLQAMHATFVAMRTSAPLAAGAISGLALAAGGLSALLVLSELNNLVEDWVSRNDDLEQMAEAITGIGDAAEFAETKVAWMTRSGAFGSEELVTGSEALDRFADSAQIAFGDSFWDKVGRLQKPGSFDGFVEDAEGLDMALAQLVNSGNAEDAEILFGEFWDRVKDREGVTHEEVIQAFTQYQEALAGATAANAEAAASFDAANFPDLAPTMTDNERAIAAQTDTMDEGSEAAQAMAQAYATLLGEMGGGASAFVSLTGALSETQAKTQEWAQGQADATESTKDSWEDFYDGHTIQLDEYLAELQSMVDAQANWQSNMSSLVGKVSDDTLAELARLGPEAAPLVQALVDGTDAQLAEFEKNFGASGAEAGGAWADGLLGEQSVAQIALATDRLSGLANQQILDGLRSGEMSAAEAVLRYNLKAELEVAADTDPAAAAVLAEVNAIEATTATANVAADVGGAVESTTAYLHATDNSVGTVTVKANTGPGSRSVADFEYETNNTSATVDVNAATNDAYSGVYGLIAWIGAQRPVLRVGMSRLALADGGGVPTGYNAMHSGAGRVSGPGTSTSDSINAHLSDNEHVWASREVDALGGHAEMYRLRKAVLAGKVRYDVGGQFGAPRQERYGAMVQYIPTPTPAPQVASGGAGVDASAIGREVAAAISGYQPLVRIGDREFKGLMVRTDAKYRGRA